MADPELVDDVGMETSNTRSGGPAQAWFGGLGILVGEMDDINDHEEEDLAALKLIDLKFYLNGKWWYYATRSGLNEAIEAVKAAIPQYPEGHTERRELEVRLAELMRIKWGRTRKGVNILQEAIRATEVTLDGGLFDDYERTEIGRKLVDLYASRFEITGSVPALEDAIRISRRESRMSSTIGQKPLRHEAELFRLALGSPVETEPIEKATRVAEAAVKATPQDDLDLGVRLDNLRGLLLVAYYQQRWRDHSISKIEEAILLTRKAIEIEQDPYPGRPPPLEILGCLLFLMTSILHGRHLSYGLAGSLDEAIRIMPEVIELTPPDHPERNERMKSLGDLLSSRFIETGAVTDLEEAIRVTELSTAQGEQGGRVHVFETLGRRLRDKYERTRDPDDLEKAIKQTKKAVTLTTEQENDRPRLLSQLAHTFQTRYLATGATEDADEAIGLLKSVDDSTADSDPAKHRALLQLANLYIYRFEDTSTMSYIDQALQYLGKGMVVTTEGGRSRGEMFVHYGKALHSRFTAIGNPKDLKQAIWYVEKGSERYYTEPWVASLLAKLYTARYHMTQCRSDILDAISYHDSALSSANLPKESYIRTGRDLISCCAIVSDWEKSYDIVSTVAEHIPELMSRYLENSDKQYNLRNIAGIASDAAAVSLSAGKGPLAALRFLEQYRGVLSASLADLRIDIVDLQEKHPQLSEEFDMLRKVIQRDDSLKDPLEDEGIPPWRYGENRRYDAGKELDKLVLEIREQPGFEEFLLPPNEEEIRAAANPGPIIVINASVYRCDAILVESHQIRSIALPGLTLDEIQIRTRNLDSANPKVLEWLWDVVAKPVLDALGLTQTPNDIWPHIWWIPTGIMSKFPLHAAGYHTRGTSETVMDRAMSSYGSSIKTIINSRKYTTPHPFSSDARALLVPMEHTPGYPSLPHASKEVEMLQHYFKSINVDSVEPGRQVENIKTHLPSYSIFHFAGHGHTDPDDPLQSCLVLGDQKSEPLTVGSLFDIDLRRKPPFLAYLSACGTSQVNDQTLVDESIHLISAYQLAGFRHVIGTLWAVHDEMCVDMARLVYEGMRDEGMTDESVCRGLHDAGRKLRTDWVSASSSREANSPVVVGKADIESPHEEVDGGWQLLSDLTVSDDGGERSITPAHWISYVHFGI